MQRAVATVPSLRQEGGAAEQREKQLERVLGSRRSDLAFHSTHAQRSGDIQLKKFLRARTRVLPVQTPHGTVGEHAPLHRAITGDINARQVAKHLGRRRTEVARLQVTATSLVAAIQFAQPSLGFDNGEAQPWSIRFATR